jgi:tetratricopeptide (TPR) repeat protein
LLSIRSKLAVAALCLCALLNARAASAATKAYAAQALCFSDPPRDRAVQVKACDEILATQGQSNQRYAQAHAFRALSLYASGDRTGALADVDRATKLDPAYFVPYSLRGRVYADRGDYDGAIAQFDIALRMEPRYAFGHWWRGQAYAAKGDYERAIADYDIAIQRLPGMQIYFSRGVARLRRGEAKLADEDFDKATAAAPNGPALSWLAVGYLDLGLYDRAILVFDRSILKEPQRADTWNERCWARAQAGKDLGLALADCDHALTLSPNDPAFLDSRALVRFRSGDYAGAVADLDAALKIKQTANALYVRGVARKKLGQAEGQRDIVMALVLDPKVAELYASRGVRP